VTDIKSVQAALAQRSLLMSSQQLGLFSSNAINIKRSKKQRCKTPPEKALLGSLRQSAAAAVVILAHASFPQRLAWLAWHNPCVGLVVASELQPGNRQPGSADLLLAATWMPIKNASEGMHVGIVRTEVEALKTALSWYPSARYLYVVSGDSVPVKHAACFAAPPTCMTSTSVTGARLLTSCNKDDASNFQGWFAGSQWLMLPRQHAQQLVEAWPAFDASFAKLNSAWWHREHNHGRDSPDEEYLHTLLHHHLRVPYFLDNITIMDEVGCTF
jgi:hypothetical protein